MIDALWLPFCTLAGFGFGIAVGLTRRHASPPIAKPAAASPPPAPPEPDFVIAPGDIIETRMGNRPAAMMRSRVIGWATFEGPKEQEHRVLHREIGVEGKNAVSWYVRPTGIVRVLPKDACKKCGQSVPERGYRDAERPS